jgi:hypothetical protein
MEVLNIIIMSNIIKKSKLNFEFLLLHIILYNKNILVFSFYIINFIFILIIFYLLYNIKNLIIKN